MSRERKFHALIEQQNQEEKDAVWAKIQQKEAESKGEVPSAPPSPRAFSWRKWLPTAAVSLAVLVVGGVATWGFLSLQNGENGGRYFTSQSYEKVNTQTNLKGYAQAIGKDLLYFDWYEQTDYVKNQAWQVKDTQEIICFQEEIIDINTGCLLYFFVMEADTTIEDFSLGEEDEQISQVKGVEIAWDYSRFNAHASFVYEDYRYLLQVEEPIDEGYILDLVEDLIP